MNTKIFLNLSICLSALALTAPISITQAAETIIASFVSAIEEGDGPSWPGRISGDGSTIVYVSQALSLVPDDTNGKLDVFVFERNAGTIKRVSVDTEGNDANNHSRFQDVAINGDGCIVAFTSNASDLVIGDTNGNTDVFAKNHCTNAATELISVAHDGGPADEGSGNWTDSVSISYDGCKVVFPSCATNIVQAAGAPECDVYMRNRCTGTTERVSVTSEGSLGNEVSGAPVGISPNGQFVSFSSWATDMVPGSSYSGGGLYVRDLLDGITTPLIDADAFTGSGGDPFIHGISGDGRYVAFSSEADDLVPGDSNGLFDVFVQDLSTGTTERVSVNNNGTEGDGKSWLPRISDNGRFVVFESNSSNLDLTYSGSPFISAKQTYVHDRMLGTTEIVSLSSRTGSEGDADTRHVGFVFSVPDISANGEAVSFTSYGFLTDHFSDFNSNVYMRELGPFPPDEQVEALVWEIMLLNLDNGISNSLNAKLESAIKALADMNENNDVEACGSMNALISAVEAQAGNKIGIDDAIEIIDRAIAIFEQLGCSD